MSVVLWSRPRECLHSVPSVPFAVWFTLLPSRLELWPCSRAFALVIYPGLLHPFTLHSSGRSVYSSHCGGPQHNKSFVCVWNWEKSEILAVLFMTFEYLECHRELFPVLVLSILSPQIPFQMVFPPTWQETQSCSGVPRAFQPLIRARRLQVTRFQLLFPRPESSDTREAGPGCQELRALGLSLWFSKFGFLFAGQAIFSCIELFYVKKLLILKFRRRVSSVVHKKVNRERKRENILLCKYFPI